jgi:ketosteroid isomerase-like protein
MGDEQMPGAKPYEGLARKQAEMEVREIIERWARAIREGDRQSILANHSDDILMFDFPEVVRGIDAYDKTWDFFFADPRGPIVFTPRHIDVTAGADVAFATCLVHCDGTSAGPLDFRLTTGLCKIGRQWTVTHEHHSVPTVEERFIEPDSN